MCDVDAEAVVAAVDAPSIYEIPKVLHAEGLDAYVVRRLGLPFRDVDWTVWGDLLDRVHHPRAEVTIGLVGKYIDLPDAYLSVAEALRAGGFAHRAKVNIRWVPVRLLRDAGRGRGRRSTGLDGVVDPGRLRHPRHRGQGRRAAVRPRARASPRSGCASACSAWSSRPRATWPASPTRTRPSSRRRRRTR